MALIRILGGIIAAPLMFVALTSHAQEAEADPIGSLDWTIGPATVSVPGGAQFEVPEGFAFLDADETVKFQEINQNIPGNRQTVFAPLNLEWFALFEFEDTGYIQDNEEIDADAILEGIRESQREANEELKKRGWATMTIDGWSYNPRYDPESNRLEWALTATSHPTGQKVVNFNTRILGRRGVMKVTLVTEPVHLEADVPGFKAALAGFGFLPDEQYAAFREGDKVAAYGLGALILGGAAAAGAKSGLLKSVGKFILFGVLALFAGLWSRIKGLFGSKKAE
ncbi:hypothetical protein GCM10011521_06660 [Arenimonas soli]|uniref:DUF2167 domain-containing protein n=1 Tax=Arenimonas soli TaxID=2269504 RepID=A0ABQ1HCL4_9GAMM|nr:DUF2167 domain-containing protein [Arenimonas soli]GGA71199.1 hypothetical protein GCM10011521_06660 [Arenimonas soli]